MAEAYKAVFTCPAFKERRIWWVKDRTEAKRHLFHHIRHNNRRLKRYQEHEWEFKVLPIFASDSDSGCDYSTFA